MNFSINAHLRQGDRVHASAHGRDRHAWVEIGDIAVHGDTAQLLDTLLVAVERLADADGQRLTEMESAGLAYVAQRVTLRLRGATAAEAQARTEIRDTLGLPRLCGAEDVDGLECVLAPGHDGAHTADREDGWRMRWTQDARGPLGGRIAAQQTDEVAS